MLFALPHDRAWPLHDVAATRRIEQRALARLPAHTLMQRAGLSVARLALALAPHARTFWIACGPGNNGGDGLEAAVHLQRWGAAPLVTWLGDEAQLPDDARAALARARAAGVPFADTPPALGPHDLCIDALLGLGATRAPSGRMADWLRQMDASAAPRLSVDVPSGLAGDTGCLAVAPAAAQDPARLPATLRRHTLSLLTLKPGLFTADGRDAVGRLWFDDLSIAADEAPCAWLAAPPPPLLRSHASHKGRFGDVAVIGGEHDAARGSAMVGAALLAASAALHGGAGRVYVSLLGDGGIALDVNQPELMFRRLDALDLSALTVVCGCGGGPAVAAALPAVLAQAPRAVLDADALNALAGDPALQTALAARAARGQTTVLTPHPLEAARLLGGSTQAVQADRLTSARQLAQRWRCVVVLKGSGTVIAAPGAVPHLNPTGNARLASAGTGDVLAGLIGARLAAGLNALEAATQAVHAHGAAADAWGDRRTLTAGALACAVCFHSLESTASAVSAG